MVLLSAIVLILAWSSIASTFLSRASIRSLLERIFSVPRIFSLILFFTLLTTMYFVMVNIVQESIKAAFK